MQFLAIITSAVTLATVVVAGPTVLMERQIDCPAIELSFCVTDLVGLLVGFPPEVPPACMGATVETLPNCFCAVAALEEGPIERPASCDNCLPTTPTCT